MTPLALAERRAQLFWVGARRPEVKAQDGRMVATQEACRAAIGIYGSRVEMKMTWQS